MANYDEMSITELQERKQELTHQFEEIRAERKAVNAVLNRKLEQQAAQERLANMTDNERTAMAQAINANGIGSGEAFGEIGNVG